MSHIQRLSDPSRVFAWCATRFEGTGVDTLFALDRQLGNIVRTTVQPLVGQMRLTWWYEALQKLDGEPAPAQPLLRSIANEALPRGVSGHALAVMSEGWEVLLEDDLHGDDVLLRFARQRGGTMFRAAGQLLADGCEDSDERLEDAGAIWALADLAANVSLAGTREQARFTALAMADQVFATSWPRARVLGALAWDARAALLGRGAADGPRRAAGATRFRMIGR